MIIPCAYLGPVSYYRELIAQKYAETEIWESFPKRTFRNRCLILGVNGVQMLTIPVCKCDSKQYTKDVRINYQIPWQQQHWMALKSAYEHTPYFMYYEDFFRPFYEKRWDFLVDYDMEIQEQVLQLMDIQTKIAQTSTWQGKLSEEIWDQKHEREYNTYYQIFADKHGFQKNLSIIDILFNMGPESIVLM